MASPMKISSPAKPSPAKPQTPKSNPVEVVAEPKKATRKRRAKKVATKESSTVETPLDPQKELKRKQKRIRLDAWIEASRRHGYLLVGMFNPLPTKGTVQHTMIKSTYDQLVKEWLELGQVPDEFKRVPKQKVVREKTPRKRATQDEKEEEGASVKKPAKKRASKKKESDDNNQESNTSDEPPKKRAKRAKKAPQVTVSIPSSDPAPEVPATPRHQAVV